MGGIQTCLIDTDEHFMIQYSTPVKDDEYHLDQRQVDDQPMTKKENFFANRIHDVWIKE